VHLPVLAIGDYYNFMSTMMIVLFIIGIVVIFVYEYEALRRTHPKP
jgi:heme/copper-type cytochrome/quinol oxidase subunit 2